MTQKNFLQYLQIANRCKQPSASNFYNVAVAEDNWDIQLEFR